MAAAAGAEPSRALHAWQSTHWAISPAFPGTQQGAGEEWGTHGVPATQAG